MKTKLLCIYHANCADGFGAAWVVREFYGEKNVEFCAATHGHYPPNVTDREVLIVDFSYKRDTLIDMAQQAKAIRVIDHHKSAAADLVDLPSNVEVTFDMKRSGAGLVWDELFMGSMRPWFIRLIEDRDLWLFKDPKTKPFSAWLFSQPYDFRVYDNLRESMTCPPSVLEQGNAIERKHAKDCDEMIASSRGTVDILGRTVPAINAPHLYSSELGHKLCDLSSEGFAATYYHDGQMWRFSLRSVGDVDVSLMAAAYGGGGHKNAAGFAVNSLSDL